MKTKVTVLAFCALFGGGSGLFAGPGIGISVNPGVRWCGPTPICRPVVYRTVPTWYATPPTAFYSWGPSVVVSSSGSGFSTVSPLMNFTGSEPVYRIPPPVLPAQPVTVYPSSPFRWRN